MNIRPPFRAGTFYEGSTVSCRHHANKLLGAAELREDLPERLYGGLVPHAGWMYSGKLAAMTLKTLDTSRSLETVVLLGADHAGVARMGELYNSGVWQTPLGEVQIDQQLASAMLAASDCLRANPEAHSHEHSLEVQVPLLQALRESVRIVPITVPPTGSAVEIGRAVAEAIGDREDVYVVGSTDLSHHGGHFPAPGGHGRAGVQWTVRNDRRMLDLIEAMEAERIVPEADARGNACGAGAVAATISACKQMGASRGLCLKYTNSYEVTHEMYADERDDTTVGYASVVFA
ncbi:MAG: AmmeMemoRadiSam system protein B [Phycisphaerae bacterium]|nr:AmmeMemoRadiSam system protein B [Phycisphaerae bacterium]